LFYGCDFFFISLFFSASLISAVREPIWLKFGMLTGSWCDLWTQVPNFGGGAKIWQIWNSAYSSDL